MNSQGQERQSNWCLLGRSVPRSEIVFFCQVIIIYTVIITCIYNLSTGNEPTNLWITLLGSSLGYLLPSPSIQKKTN